MDRSSNPEQELAFNYICQTNRHVFLTGKAGTGKTTFLHRVRAEVPKRMAVAAPTGVAAINAKGVTIHSLFQLPFGVILPGMIRERSFRFSQRKLDLIRCLDLLIIDEISMVRADVLDGIDEMLRRLRGSRESFGGVQLLMIGDLHQLPPVVSDNDWHQLRGHYETAYFFGSHALRKARPATIQLKRIYRQSDERFIGLLNKVRNNQLDATVLSALNERFVANFVPAEEAGYITLTSHNRAAEQLNTARLNALRGKSWTFRATTKDDFPEKLYPNQPELCFKVGAQVMFNKNDTVLHEYFNGKIGKITAIRDEQIVVQCPGDKDPIYVEPVVWENRKFEADPQSREVIDVVIGTYTQHPLKLAWAITIHKSQGLTFDKVVIDAAAAFAHGQVYVALSRCRTFDGIVLSSRIGDESVRTDKVVKDYSQQAAARQPGPDELLADRRRFQLRCLRRLFAAEALARTAARLERELLEHERYMQGGALPIYQQAYGQLREKVLTLSEKFLPHLDNYARQPPLLDNNAELQARLKAAAGYFLPPLRQDFLPMLDNLPIMSDNQQVLKTVKKHYLQVQRAAFVWVRMLEAVAQGFDSQRFLRQQADAAADFDEQQRKQKGTSRKTVQNLPHPVLYARLEEWRAAKAREQNIQAARVLKTATLLELNHVLPTRKKHLLAVKGFGASRYQKVGEEVLDIIRQYAEKRDIATDQLDKASGKVKEDTKAISLELFRSGQDIASIAAHRKLTETTIEGHLAHWVRTGEIAATELLPPKLLATLTAYFAEHPELPLREAHAAHAGAYSYGQLRIAQAAWEMTHALTREKE